MFHVKQIATIGAIWSIDSSSGHPYLPVSDAGAVGREVCRLQRTRRERSEQK